MFIRNGTVLSKLILMAEFVIWQIWKQVLENSHKQMTGYLLAIFDGHRLAQNGQRGSEMIL